MKKIYYLGVCLLLIFSIFNCKSVGKKINVSNSEEEPVVIKNDSLEYEIIIIDSGFNSYLISVAKPNEFYSQSYLEVQNRFYVPVWNSRVNNPSRFNPNIYGNIIEYDPHIDYGYDVNFKLFNYFEFAQKKYRMKLR